MILLNILSSLHVKNFPYLMKVLVILFAAKFNYCFFILKDILQRKNYSNGEQGNHLFYKVLRYWERKILKDHNNKKIAIRSLVRVSNAVD